MSRGSKVVLAYVPQTDEATVPSTGWKILPYKSVSLGSKFELLDSETITDARIQQAGVVKSASVEGDIEVEFAKDIYDDLVAAAAFNDWNGDVLSFGGNVQKMFAIERAMKDVGIYHLYTGCRVNTFKLSISDGGYASASFGFMGSDYKNQNDTAFALNPIAAATNVMRVSKMSVEDIKIDGVTTKGRACVTEFSFEVDNNMQSQACLGGGLYASNLLEMMAKISGSLSLAYGKPAQDIVNKQMSGATIAIEVTLKFPDNSKYVLTISKAQIAGETPSGGMNDLITQQLTYTAVEVAPTLTRIPA